MPNSGFGHLYVEIMIIEDETISFSAVLQISSK